MGVVLSKSKYISGLQCPKLLWTLYNAKGSIPAESGKQAVFDQGHEIGEWAKQRYPDGLEVEWGRGFSYTLSRTKELLGLRRPIYEGSFAHKNAYARADILVPAGDEWDLVEVKSSTSVKDVYYEDVALQAYCVQGNGVKLRRMLVMYINKEYVRQGAIDPAQLFLTEDVTARVSSMLPALEAQLGGMVSTINAPACPQTAIGPQCTTPYDCPLLDACWAFLPPDNVTELYYIGRKAFPLLAEFSRIVDVPAERLSEKQRVQQAALKAGAPYVDGDRIKEWLAGLSYPLYCIDFETMNPALPLFDGTRPYQQVPFQVSIHIINRPEDLLGISSGIAGGDTNRAAGADRTTSLGVNPDAIPHVEYLCTEAVDPRPGIVEALKSIGPTGTVLSFNQGFEKRIISDLKALGSAEFLTSLDARMQDLATPFKNFWYYHPSQHGQYSIKAVLPAMTSLSYDNLEIGDGETAAQRYLAVTFGKASAEEKAQVYSALRTYCGQDTWGMVEILTTLKALEQQNL